MKDDHGSSPYETTRIEDHDDSSTEFDETIDLNDKDYMSTGSHPTKRRWLAALREHGWLVNAVLLLVIIVQLVEKGWHKHGKDHYFEGAGDLTGFAPEFPQQITKFTPDPGFVPENTSEFFTEETRRKWLGLVPRGLGYLEIPNPGDYDNLPTPLAEFPDQFVVTSSMTHQLHCLSIMCCGDVALEGEQTTFPDGVKINIANKPEWTPSNAAPGDEDYDEDDYIYWNFMQRWSPLVTWPNRPIPGGSGCLKYRLGIFIHKHTYSRGTDTVKKAYVAYSVSIWDREVGQRSGYAPRRRLGGVETFEILQIENDYSALIRLQGCSYRTMEPRFSYWGAVEIILWCMNNIDNATPGFLLRLPDTEVLENEYQLENNAHFAREVGQLFRLLRTSNGGLVQDWAIDAVIGV
ncbi:hypothetical protein DL769_003974 [Monosporascus sp. CRB-8-3]|nr:hypothetical protein DL769_003974 [Monosporascus sp. CRB-8-3]